MNFDKIKYNKEESLKQKFKKYKIILFKILKKI